MYRSALARTESRGMHRRLEHARLDPAQRHRLISGGLDEIWLRQEPVTDQVQEVGTGVPA
jgi:succinate dehydrogenase/fumarate reductase flavoprotein subunit